MQTGDKQRLTDFDQQLPNPIEIYYRRAPSPNKSQFSQFCEDLGRLSSRIKVVQQPAEPPEAAAILVKPQITYHAIPHGPELEPFLTALRYAGQGPDASIQALTDALKPLTMPAELKIFIAPQCPFCPSMVRQGVQIAFGSQRIRLIVIDAFLFPEMAAEQKVQSTPTTILDNFYRWTGAVKTDEIVEALIHRDPRQLGYRTFERIIEEGNAGQIAQMMLEKKEIFPVFFDLLTHSSLPVRLGAMVAAEELLDKNPPLARELTLPLLGHLKDLEEPVMGDVIYLLGETGDPRIVPILKEMADQDFSHQIKESIQEALEQF